MALSQETKDILWFVGYPMFFLLMLFAGALWITTVDARVKEHIAYEDSILGARNLEQVDFSYIEDSVERYKTAEQYYQTVFWNSLDTVQRSYLAGVERYQDSLTNIKTDSK